MIYEPQPFFNVYEALGGSLIAALARLATDYVIGDLKPWQYYLGYGFGGAALATGIPDANAILYVIGAGTVKIFFETSPGAAEARVFLDGVQDADLDLSDEVVDIVEHVLNIPDDGLQHAIMVYNLGTNVAHESPTNWLSILGIETTLDSNPREKDPIAMAYNVVTFRMQDAEANTTDATVPVYLPTGFTLAQIQAWVDAFIAQLDAATASMISEVTVALQLTLAGGIKTEPEAGAYNERGGLITFATSGPRASSFRIPAIKTSIMPGDSFSLANTTIAALVTSLTTATTAANIRPRTEQDYQFVTARKGSKSQRKQ